MIARYGARRIECAEPRSSCHTGGREEEKEQANDDKAGEDDLCGCSFARQSFGA